MSTTVQLAQGCFFHIYNRGINSSQVFFSNENYTYFLRLYAKYMFDVFDTYAYCLLGNHYHFLIRVKTNSERLVILKRDFEFGLITREQYQEKSILKPAYHHFNVMQIAYTKAINKQFKRTGGLMERPFKRKPVEDSVYFLNLIAYIHQNPQKHGIVDNFEDWPWSSYGAYLKDSDTRLQKEIVFDWFGGKQDFLDFHQIEADECQISALVADDLL